MNKKLKKSLQGVLLGLFLFLPPIILYFFIKWDPTIYMGGDENPPLAAYLLTIIYWVVFYQIYKYKERSKERTWQFAQFLSDKWTIEKREEERIKLTSNVLYMNKLKEEYPELFEDKILKLP